MILSSKNTVPILYYPIYGQFFSVLQINHLAKCNTTKYSMNWALVNKLSDPMIQKITDFLYYPICSEFFLVLQITSLVTCNTTKYAMNCTFVIKITDHMLKEYCHNSILPYTLSIFLGIANYPFGKMQFHQVWNEFCILE